MEALQFDVSVPRYIAGKVLGAVYEPLLWSGLSCLRYGEIDEPSLPGPDWVKIHTRYGGICGTDWGWIHLHNSLYLAPFGSERFVLGHENLGTIAEVGPEVEGWSVGERAIADLLLPCAPRGFEDACPACQRGDYNLCENFIEGALAPGSILGSCADTGGSWGPVYVAHRSQLVHVPEAVEDEDAILAYGPATKDDKTWTRVYLCEENRWVPLEIETPQYLVHEVALEYDPVHKVAVLLWPPRFEQDIRPHLFRLDVEKLR